jgi:hypothetical protein
MKTYEKIEEVIEHLLYSEMGGEVDYSDPWYPTFKALHELKEKTFEEEEGRPYWLDALINKKSWYEPGSIKGREEKQSTNRG